jgi:oxalate decarboxylase/phosphoglucose isomerase-like protein (cupin superfamily)
MAQETATPASQADNQGPFRGAKPYDDWIGSLGLPIHRGYYLEDVRTAEVEWWEERQAKVAFMQLAGQQGAAEARITEVPPGATLPAARFGFDESVYVADGQGVCTVWGADGQKKTFEWQKHSLFMLPHNRWHQITNMRGDRPARLVHYNYLPVAMSVIPDPEFFFDNNYGDQKKLATPSGEYYSEAKIEHDTLWGRKRAKWYGSFFPDMRAWDQLVPFWGRGAGGRVVHIEFPESQMTCHMSVFDARTYKKGHRHGPGFVIIIPVGEGYSIMWPEGEEKVIIPWHEGSVFVPPNRWFHQHFNVGEAPARYLAWHPLPQMMGSGERVDNRAQNQIEYPFEEPWIRQRYEEELAKRGLTSIMPEEAYKDPNFEWEYAGES